MMKQLDLFAGIGGISLAAEWAGIETVAFCEKDPFCQGVLRRRFPGRPIYDDVFDLTREVLERDGIVGIDIIAGGFPCQPFSHAGKREGTADDRYLWPEMYRIIAELRPTWVFAENVDGLISMAQSDWNLVMEDETTLCEEAEMVLETIRKDLETIGYQSVPIVVPAAAVGASHRRYRVFIVAYTEGKRRGAWGTESEGQQRELCSSWSCSSRETLAYTSGAGCEERHFAAEPNRTGYSSRRLDPGGAYRPTQPGMGRGPYELSDWLDGWGPNPLDGLINFISSFPQPALMGQPQYKWEPPRVTTGAKNRAARLKALGNAVNPLQALPILYGIRVIHEFLQKGGQGFIDGTGH